MIFGATPLKKFPAPFFKPHWPFFAAGLIIFYGVSSAQSAMMKSDEWKNDPRNPNAKSVGH
ncbi:ATP synthase j chain-domain-containing protein [Stachybotrys elegans]|uniref:ATP synthase j chain-domain-containing protein n=1 Tax=Stachybotrys elegans TaxID=80388 RepID=A0A8K0WPW4_9HYPO|nr:ATP synthase j chain-domain-containing protein [Stachybotrys elegans]